MEKTGLVNHRLYFYFLVANFWKPFTIAPMKPKYKRILLKLSGEALLGEKEFGIDYDILHTICKEIEAVQKLGIEIAVVIGAGNIWRGSENGESGIDRVPSDYIGMMGTLMNSVALQANLEKIGGVYTGGFGLGYSFRCRTLYPKTGDATPRKRTGRDLWGRNGKPLFYNRFCRGTSGVGTGMRGSD